MCFMARAGQVCYLSPSTNSSVAVSCRGLGRPSVPNPGVVPNTLFPLGAAKDCTVYSTLSRHSGKHMGYHSLKEVKNPFMYSWYKQAISIEKYTNICTACQKESCWGGKKKEILLTNRIRKAFRRVTKTSRTVERLCSYLGWVFPPSPTHYNRHPHTTIVHPFLPITIEQLTHGLLNYIDTQRKCRHQKNWPVEELCVY